MGKGKKMMIIKEPPPLPKKVHNTYNRSLENLTSLNLYTITDKHVLLYCIVNKPFYHTSPYKLFHSLV